MDQKLIKGICYTEKSTGLGSAANQYVFDVDVQSSKEEIAAAVSTFFKVSVLKVNTLRRDGKLRRNRMKRGAYGVTPRRKIAIVTLKAGERIEIV